MKFPGDTPITSISMIISFGLLSGAAVKHMLARKERNQSLQQLRDAAVDQAESLSSRRDTQSPQKH